MENGVQMKNDLLLKRYLMPKTKKDWFLGLNTLGNTRVNDISNQNTITNDDSPSMWFLHTHIRCIYILW